MKITSVIFDFDGTLFDSMPVWDGAGEAYLRSIGREPKPGLKETVQTMSLYQAACYLQKEYDLELTAEEIIDGVSRVVADAYRYQILPKPGVPEFLAALKEAGITMGIATASERPLIEAALVRCGLLAFFERILTCSEAKSGKDSPEIFQKMAELLHADCSNTVVFEDAFHAARTAKGAGFAVTGVYDPSEPEQDGMKKLCDCYLPDFYHTETFWKLERV